MSFTILPVDITAITGYGATQNPNACLSYQVGNSRSGEIYNESATVFRSPGLISLPVSVGNFTSTGTFTSSTYSVTCSQALALESNSNWFVLGVRDTRNQALLPATQNGETRLFPEGNPNSFIYLDLQGDLFLQTDINNSASLTGVAKTINLQNSSTAPAKHAAVAEQTDTNFQNILSSINTLYTSASAIVATPPISLPTALADITALATMIQTFCQSIQASGFPSTKSSFINISG